MSEAILKRTSTLFADAANVAFLLMIALLPWMKHGLIVRGLPVFPADFLFVLTAALWGAALASGQVRLRLHPAFVLLAFYFVAMALSLAVSNDVRASAFKLLTQVYLLVLPVLVFNLVTDAAAARRVLLCWVASATAVGVYGAATLLLFPFFGYHSFLAEPLHHFGTLPPGPYPRIELTFEYPAMLANYLGVSLMILLVAGKLGWVGSIAVRAGAVLMLVSALFALTPGFAGLVAMLCLWIAYRQKSDRPKVAALAVAAAAGSTILELLVSAVTPIVHPTAPFLIHISGFAEPWAPGVRLMVWIDAAHNFLASPVLGHGIGVDPVHVLYQAPEDASPGFVTDAHNVFLSVGVQCGIVGLLALAAIIWLVIREARSASSAGRQNALLMGLAIAWLGSFVIQGLVGAFEDARHLWILFGLILAASGSAMAESPSGLRSDSAQFGG